MCFERIDENMLCKGYWVSGNHDGQESFVCVQDIYENGVLSTDGRFFLFEELSGIELTHEWLQEAGAEHLTEGEMAKHHGAYYIPAFPFTFLLHEYVAVLYKDETFAGFRFVHELQHFYAGIKQRSLRISAPQSVSGIKKQQLRFDFSSDN